MWISAVRLKEVGRFSDGVAIEGFGAGLNVLAAQNEAGKSTVLRALRRLFDTPHTSQATKVNALRPNVGGAPLIECDFHIDNQHWRLRKRYIAERQAELRRLDGETLFRSSDVEAELARMFGGEAGLNQAGNLVWVDQNESFVPPKLMEDQQTSLAGLMQSEIDATSGTGQISAVLSLVEDELFKYLTPTGRTKKGGPLHLAEQQHRAAREAFQSASEKAENARQRQAGLAAVEKQIAELTDPQTAAARDAALAESRQQLERATDARTKAADADARRTQAEQAFQIAQTNHQRMETAIRELEAAVARIQNLQAIRTATQAQVAENDVAIAALDREIVDLRARYGTLQTARRQTEQRARLDEQQAATNDKEKRLQTVREIEQELQDVRERIAACPVKRSDLKDLIKWDEDIRLLEAELRASAPTLEVGYDAAASRRFKVDGLPLHEGESRSVLHPLTVEAEGVGRLTVLPASPEEAAHRAQRHANAVVARSSWFAQFGFADRDVAEAAVATREDLERRAHELSANLRGLAPDGAEMLAQQCAEGQARIEAMRDEVDRNEIDLEDHPADWQAALKTVERDLRAREQTRTETAGRLARCRERLAGLQSELDGLEVRVSAIAEGLPPEEARASERERLKLAVCAAQATLNDAVREQTAWRDAAPDDDRLSALKARAMQSERSLQDAREKQTSLRERRRELEGALRRDMEDGVAADVTEKTQRLERAERRVGEVQREADALKILWEELDEARKAHRAKLSDPILKRLQPMAAHLFPDVDFSLGDQFEVTAMVRGGQTEEFEQLSAGTGEQIAVLARLALAQTIAETKSPLPVIFDDAMVFSDDDRLARVFDVLCEAATHHQVIVLTCHVRAFAGLLARPGCTSLQMTPWTNRV